MKGIGNTNPKQSSGRLSRMVQHFFVTSLTLKCFTAFTQLGIVFTSDRQDIGLGNNPFSDWGPNADDGARARSFLFSFPFVCIDIDSIIIKANMIVVHILCMFPLSLFNVWNCFYLKITICSLVFIILVRMVFRVGNLYCFFITF